METVGLDHVSLEVREGEFLCIIGHTGSGKSTVIQHMNGLLKPDSGEVLYQGENIFAKNYDRRALRGRVGLVFQYPEHQLFEETVLKDVSFGPRNQGFSVEEAAAKAKKALEAVHLPESYYERSPFELSGGEKRKVAIAGALAMEPSILILDEPTAGLDPAGRKELLRCLKDRQAEGMGIVLVSHSMEDAAACADRILVMHEGHILRQGTPAEVFSEAELLESVGLTVPALVRILQRLKKDGLAVDTGAMTMEAAVQTIMKNFS